MERKANSGLIARIQAALLLLLLRCLSFTYRLSPSAKFSRILSMDASSAPLIISCWHNRGFFFAALSNRILGEGMRLAMMSSLSKDGEIGAQLARRLGMKVTRGSASQNGTQGMRGLYRAIVKENCSIIIMPDGSKGPIYEAKLGAAALAQMTQRPILPLSFAANRYWRAGSWDKLIIPKPFARISIEEGDMITVPREASSGDLEQARSNLEDSLNNLGQKAWVDIAGASGKEKTCAKAF